MTVLAPMIGRVLDHAFRHHGGAVAPVEGEVAPVGSEAVAEERVVPTDAAMELARIGVDQEFVRVKPVSMPRLVGAMHPVGVERPGRRPSR